jgi:hydroxymethylbilane synthase
MTQNIIIGSRGSDLALWQANHIKQNLVALHPNTRFEIKIIRTTGDKLQDVALSKIGDKGLFTRQIENELLNGSIDLAVHSLKDLQTVQPDGLTIGAVCRREIPNDVLVSRRYSSLSDLPKGAAVATGSLRRRSQLLRLRTDLKIVEIRGNVPTRLKKYLDSDLDGMILAYAGLHRLDLDSNMCHRIPTSNMLPAVGQGAVAVEIRSDDKNVKSLVQALDHYDTRICVTAERGFLKRLEGGCQVPIGALATINRESLQLEGMVSSLDGSQMFRRTVSGIVSTAEALGIGLAEDLISMGADKVLIEARSHSIGSEGSVL